MAENFKDIEDVEEVEEIELPIEHKTIGRLVSVPDVVINAVNARIKQIEIDKAETNRIFAEEQEKHDKFVDYLIQKKNGLSKEMNELKDFLKETR